MESVPELNKRQRRASARLGRERRGQLEAGVVEDKLMEYLEEHDATCAKYCIVFSQAIREGLITNWPSIQEARGGASKQQLPWQEG